MEVDVPAIVNVMALCGMGVDVAAMVSVIEL